ncbi:MAG: hypothetical protein K2Q11_08515 [Burkholderiaceae bacterium]|nr:hypothetical protein [Burkholderiaceae bacterium]
MSQLKISIVSLGSLKYPINMTYLEGWKSRIINVSHGASIAHLPDADGSNWEYTREQLSGLIKDDGNYNFIIGLISAPLEHNYYMHRLGDKIAVLSLFEMAEIVRLYDFTIENYMLRNIYELAVLYKVNSTLIPSDMYSWAHDDVRGCLFDMNANKSDIVFSLHQPKICHACNARILSNQVDAEFLPELSKDLKKLKKSLYFLMAEWVKLHPVLALIMAALSATSINLISSIIFEKSKAIFSWLG